MDPVINIITRTHNRPNFFKNCVGFIKQQTYKSIHHIVTYQTNEDYKYVVKHNPEATTVKVPTVKKDFSKSTIIYDNVKADHAPYNTHFNIAHKYVKEGWVLYIDDDDMLSYSNSIEYLAQNIKLHNTNNILHLWFVNFIDYTVPNPNMAEKYKQGHPFKKGNCSGIGLCFHSDYLKYATWHEWALGDWDIYQKLDKVIPNRNFMNATLTGLQSLPGGGRAQDMG